MLEQAFSDLMWWFRISSGNDFNRIKKANFLQMGVIPQGIEFVKGNERFNPNPQFIELVLEKNRQLLSQHSSSYTRNAERNETNKTEKTATQVMAEVNSINTMVSGVMGLAYTFEAFKYREIARRFCIPNNPDPMVQRFRKSCIVDAGIPPKYLDIDLWDIEPDRAMGAGNKTVQMAIVQYLNSIRQNLGPEAQRKVDHDGILIVTEDVAMAEDLAPIKGQQPMGRSAHDAELSTERLMRGLPFTPTPQMVYEDYVNVWMRDMGLILKQMQAVPQTVSMPQIMGLQNMATHISMFLQIMGQTPDGAQKARQYSKLLGEMMNVVKGFAQQLQQPPQGGNGAGGPDPEAMSKLQGQAMLHQAKAANTRESHAEKTAQRQAQFELEQQRLDRKTEADIRRTDAVTAVQTAADIRSQGAKDMAAEKANTE
jgi:hypothetical protein